MKKTLLLSLITLFVCSGMAFADRSWTFTTWSQATLDNLTADATNWTNESATRFSNVNDITEGETLVANGVPIAETNGLTFGAIAASKVRIDHADADGATRLMLNGSNLVINIPNCSAGNTITVVTNTANTSTARGVVPTNATRFGGEEATSLTPLTSHFTVVANGTVSLATTGGLHFRSILVEGATSLNPAILNAKVVKNVYYGISGKVAGDNFNALKKGAYIQKTTYDNGAVIMSKFLKSVD